MTFGRQKRLLLGLLALLAPLPLPFNDVVEWPLVLLYTLGVLWFLRRAWNDPTRWLPTWVMNVLGLVYIPVFFLDIFVLSRGRLVQPILHLCLFTLLVKLFSLVRERDKWQAAIGVFFLFLAAMGTSVHPAVVLYLIAFLVLTLAMLTRFAFLHVLAGFGREDPALARLPMGGFMVLSTVLTLLLAVPLFVILPRVRSPYIIGHSLGGNTQMEAAGFSDEVTLDSIGQIRSSREVVIRLLEEGAAGPDREMRFKAATYDVYQGGSWRRTPARIQIQRGERLRFRLSTAWEPVRWVKMWLQPLHSRSLPLPVEAVTVEPRTPVLEMDEGGAVSFSFNPLEVREYRVGLAQQPVLLGIPPATPRDASLDRTNVTPRIAALARQVMGGLSPADGARRMEDYLIRNYEYTLNFSGRKANNPIEDFLFDWKSGQCEYFASSMVLLLRSHGIPARLVTGFLGGEYNPFEGYFIVRDSNAHAWVEAYLPGEGWHIFDPTPPAGRPEVIDQGAWMLARQAWDFVLFRWDRYVLTYGLYDQIRVFSSLRNMWVDFWKVFDHGHEEPVLATHPEAPAVPAAPAAEATPDAFRFDRMLPLVAVLTLFAALAWVLYLRYRPPLTATAAYRRLRHRLGRSGAPVPASVPPMRLRREAEARYPAAAAPMGRVIDFYLRESFGGEPLAEAEREALKVALGEAEKGMRRAG